MAVNCVHKVTYFMLKSRGGFHPPWLMAAYDLPKGPDTKFNVATFGARHTEKITCS